MKPTTLVQREVKRTLREHGLSDAKMVVAVSGGPDSLTLLYALHSLGEELGLELHGAHLDHGLRGGDSTADAIFVADTCRRLDIGLTSDRVDVQALKSKLRMSTEEAAREARYDFLGRVAAEQEADAVALGHTADDQAETVLMNIIRGSGLVGLRGMAPASRREIAGSAVLLFRPLLRLARHDTAAYCHELGLQPRTDESNLSMDATRNRVRLELLPLLEEYNPGIRKALWRLSRTAAAQVSYLDSEVDRVWSETAREAGGTLSVRRAEFLRLDPALRTHILRRGLHLVKGDVQGIEQVHIDAMGALMAGPSGKSLDLPGGLSFVVGHETATLAAAANTDERPLPIVGRRSLSVPGETCFGGWTVEARVVGPPPESSTEAGQETGRYAARMDLDALGGDLEVRAREPGDRFQPLGMSGHKKLQDFMVDAKVPQPWRDGVPLIVSPKGIAWVVGWRIADWAKVREGTRRVADVSFVRK